MLSFKKWYNLQEGGNVVIGDTPAERIDLKTIDRKKVISEIGKALKAISDRYASFHGMPLWGDDLFKNKGFLSGSSLHLFNTAIPDETFVKHKPTVGDIDTQVDGNQKKQIESFLKKLPPGEKVGNTLYVGYKPSGDQFITLWTIPSLGISVQVDLELVDFENGKPTPWSAFSHGSPWEDLSLGIKGVFQKYLLRAFQARTAKDVIIRAKTPRGKDKVIRKSDLAFSTKGLRVRMTPVLDVQGNQTFKNGMPVYDEVDSATADYITDLDVLFTSFFGAKGSKAEVEQMSSFVGLIGLMKKYMSQTDQKKVLDGFVNVLWERGAQGLVRNDPRADYDTKIRAFDYITKELGIGSIDEFEALINSYYKGYKND